MFSKPLSKKLFQPFWTYTVGFASINACLLTTYITFLFFSCQLCSNRERSNCAAITDRIAICHLPSSDYHKNIRDCHISKEIISNKSMEIYKIFQRRQKNYRTKTECYMELHTFCSINIIVLPGQTYPLACTRIYTRTHKHTLSHTQLLVRYSASRNSL